MRYFNYGGINSGWVATPQDFDCVCETNEGGNYAGGEDKDETDPEVPVAED